LMPLPAAEAAIVECSARKLFQILTPYYAI
jgi:hypothetical protein